MITRTLLILFLFNAGILLLASILWKNKDTSFTSLFMVGSYMFRNVAKYITKERIKAFLALSYSAIILFMCFVLSMILLGPP